MALLIQTTSSPGCSPSPRWLFMNRMSVLAFSRTGTPLGLSVEALTLILPTSVFMMNFQGPLKPLKASLLWLGCSHRYISVTSYLKQDAEMYECSSVEQHPSTSGCAVIREYFLPWFSLTVLLTQGSVYLMWLRRQMSFKIQVTFLTHLR